MAQSDFCPELPTEQPSDSMKNLKGKIFLRSHLKEPDTRTIKKQYQFHVQRGNIHNTSVITYIFNNDILETRAFNKKKKKKKLDIKQKLEVPIPLT